LAQTTGSDVTTEWTNELGVLWVPDPAPELARRWPWPTASRSVSFALASRPTAVLLVAALLAPAFGAPVTAAHASGRDPIIKLPPNAGGQTTGEENTVAPGQAAAEDLPDPTTATPVAGPAEEPAPDPAAAAPVEPTVTAPAATPDPAAAAPVEPTVTAPAATPSAPTAAPADAAPEQPPAAAAATPQATVVGAEPTPPPTSPEPVAPPAQAPAAAPPSTTVATGEAPLRSAPATPRKRHRPPAARAPRSTPPAPSTRPAAAVPTTAPPSTTTAAEPRRSTRASARVSVPRGWQTYRVVPRDSLWKIASHLLGVGASDARVAALTTALWQLNRERIGTVSPDDLPTGITILIPREDPA
jgi:hypothetical protein